MKSVKIMSLAFGLILLASAAGFAQTSMLTTFSSIPVAPNAQTGMVGEIDFVPQLSNPAGTIPAGESITVTYGAPISSLSDIKIFVLGCNGNAALTIGTQADCGVTATVNASAGSILLSFATTITTPPASQFIRITGVRVNVNAAGLAVGSVINASVTNSTGVGTITNNLVPVAQVLEPIAIAGPKLALNCPQTGCTDVEGDVVVSELFANAFETEGATFPTQIILKVTPPTGFTFATDLYTSNEGLTTSSGTVVAQIASVDASTNTITVKILSQNPQSLDSITVPIFFSAKAPVPLTPGNATVTATLAPPLTTTPPVAVGPNLGPIRYAERTVSAVIKFSVGQNQTFLYATFNVWSAALNTGFAIGNPTGIILTGKNPFFAAAQPGSVTVVLAPMDGSTPKIVDTSKVNLGLGLVNGQVPAGGEWAVLLSELAASAGFSSFEGQVFFITNFSNATGVNFIADPDFETQAQGYQMLNVGDLFVGD